MNAPIQPVTLTGTHVRLEPASPEHAAGMLAAADPDTFRLFTKQPTPWGVDACRAYIEYLIDEPKTLPFSLFDATTNEFIGGTSYCDIRPAHRNVEIGWTWIAPSRRGTAVNPEMKLLLMQHAFETDLFSTSDGTGPAIRVMLKTHHANKHSQAAISKLGATYEGTLRQHVIMPDGSFRDTVMYSILDSEWAGVKAGLEARL